MGVGEKAHQRPRQAAAQRQLSPGYQPSRPRRSEPADHERICPGVVLVQQLAADPPVSPASADGDEMSVQVVTVPGMEDLAKLAASITEFAARELLMIVLVGPQNGCGPERCRDDGGGAGASRWIAGPWAPLRLNDASEDELAAQGAPAKPVGFIVQHARHHELAAPGRAPADNRRAPLRNPVREPLPHGGDIMPGKSLEEAPMPDF